MSGALCHRRLALAAKAARPPSCNSRPNSVESHGVNVKRHAVSALGPVSTQASFGVPLLSR